ncbi:MAG TPA: hypothetical protein VFW35_09400 [Sphingomicrobium sp.]|nr:hypothetical protein [Sphingomicrobium sp.]
MLLLLSAIVMDVPYRAWFPGTSSIDEPEVIPPAFRGRWAPTPASCNAKDRVDAIVVKPGGVNFYEAGARLQRVTQAGRDRSIRLKLAYEGEGEFWDSVETWTLSKDGSKVTIVKGTESPIDLTKCHG